jgi:nitrite reductase/ring-hydroxylating ferredoxin subunit
LVRIGVTYYNNKYAIMDEKNWKWYKVMESGEAILWQSNDMCVVNAGDKKITLARFNGELHAFAEKCPHAGGIMADGYINAAGQVTCPIHRYRFDMKNGRNTSGEGYYLKVYRVEKRADGIYVGWEDKGFWPSF